MDQNKKIEQRVDEIEEEIKRIGHWQSDTLPDQAYEGQEAFLSDTMTLPQWLQFVFIPRVRETLSTNGEWPSQSQVGIYAAQQFLFFRPVPGESGVLETQGAGDRKETRLVHLLQQFDELFDSSVSG